MNHSDEIMQRYRQEWWWGNIFTQQKLWITFALSTPQDFGPSPRITYHLILTVCVYKKLEPSQKQWSKFTFHLVYTLGNWLSNGPWHFLTNGQLFWVPLFIKLQSETCKCFHSHLWVKLFYDHSSLQLPFIPNSI